MNQEVKVHGFVNYGFFIFKWLKSIAKFGLNLYYLW